MFGRLLKQCFRPRTIRRQPRRSQLILEQLEDRIVPADTGPPYFIAWPNCDQDT
jgi:hypothetical protein